jgi:hypothetical protein
LAHCRRFRNGSSSIFWVLDSVCFSYAALVVVVSNRWCFGSFHVWVGFPDIWFSDCFQICWDLQDSWSLVNLYRANVDWFVFSGHMLFFFLFGIAASWLWFLVYGGFPDIWFSDCFQICWDLHESWSLVELYRISVDWFFLVVVGSALPTSWWCLYRRRMTLIWVHLTRR